MIIPVVIVSSCICNPCLHRPCNNDDDDDDDDSENAHRDADSEDHCCTTLSAKCDRLMTSVILLLKLRITKVTTCKTKNLEIQQ